MPIVIRSRVHTYENPLTPLLCEISELLSPAPARRRGRGQRLSLWLRRFRQRRGYGVHSPWLFSLVTGVIYEDSAYYAYKHLPQVEGWAERDLQLLFRLCNHFQPTEITICGLPNGLAQWLHAGCHTASIKKIASDLPFITMQRTDGQQCIILLDCNGELWQRLSPGSVTLDLHYFGLIYRNLTIPSQHLVVNYL